jgi:hypothetical protein
MSERPKKIFESLVKLIKSVIDTIPDDDWNKTLEALKRHPKEETDSEETPTEGEADPETFIEE